MKQVRRTMMFFGILALLLSSAAGAEEKRGYALAVVPQSQVSDIFERWTPFLKRLSQEAGVEITLQPYGTFKTFEEAVYGGTPDFVYANPYELVTAWDKGQKYAPLIRDKANLAGILVVRKGGGVRSLQDVNGKEIAFPDPLAFAASLYLRAHLSEREKIRYTPVYVKTHSNVYRSVALDKAAAGGGVMKTLAKEPDEFRSQLTVLYETPSVASHPIAAHPRVPQAVSRKVAEAVFKLAEDGAGKEMLQKVNLPDPVAADYQKDYLPLKKLGLALEKYMGEKE